ncbi:hypothetical protein [Weissella paramesenteroides]|uniref:hypothetical protein n=1 Tax=Weissella paramesenteroides TaxID=1249 RepID=UPI00223C4CC9|nr:hypothetical protein [Weissella paramesenteroides]MCT0485674.1 hypothetical protein [Weissella paramesenteroides]
MTYLNTTRWINNDSSITTVDDAISRIISKNGQAIHPRNDNGVDFHDVSVNKVFDETQVGNYLDSTVKFNSVQGRFEKIRAGEPVDTNFFVIVYQVESSQKIYFIINRNTDARRILRSFLDFSGREEVTNYNVELNSNMLLYFVYRVFEGQSNFTYTLASADDLQVSVKNLTGIKGATETSNKLSADGTTISKLISTLSLLLEVKELQQVRLDTSMLKHESINISLNDSGLISIDSNDYVGILENEPNQEKQTRLLLHVYLVVLPVILNEYTDASDEDWGAEEISNFMEKIKNQLINKIDQFDSKILDQQELDFSTQENSEN